LSDPVPAAQQQHTGVPFIITQQVQPLFIIVAMQSQQAWIILQQSASPLVQVMTHPSLVISTLHLPIVRLQVQQTIPFMTQQQVIIPPCIIMHRFCIIVQDVGSGQTHVIFMPPSHFSIFIVHRGTMSMLAGAIAPMPMPIPGVDGIPVVIPGIIIPVRSPVIVPAMLLPPEWTCRTPNTPLTRGPRPREIIRLPGREMRQNRHKCPGPGTKKQARPGLFPSKSIAIVHIIG
jgi:hypothetical protein